MRNFRNYDIWKDSMLLAKNVCHHTRIFPQYSAIINQIQRSAISIPSNIAEGAARKSNKEYIQFLYIALGSAAELETQLIVSKNLNFIDDKSFDLLVKERDEIAQMLFGLIRYRKSL